MTTPSPRRCSAPRSDRVLAARHAVYQDASQRNPQRWSGPTRNWTPAGAVTLNPEPDAVVRAATSQIQLSGSIGEPAFPFFNRDPIASVFSQNPPFLCLAERAVSSPWPAGSKCVMYSSGQDWPQATAERLVAVLRAALHDATLDQLGSPFVLPGHGSFRGLPTAAAATWHRKAGTPMSRARSLKKAAAGKTGLPCLVPAGRVPP
jgi:hypothetical protein